MKGPICVQLETRFSVCLVGQQQRADRVRELLREPGPPSSHHRNRWAADDRQCHDADPASLPVAALRIRLCFTK